MAFQPSSDGVSVIHGLFPSARITSGYRSPDNPLSRANPGSWHTKSHGAVDVAPIPGMTFDQYVAEVQNAGHKVIDAHDEATHPFPWTTGPNWHIVIGK